MKRICLKHNPGEMEGVVVCLENLFEGYSSVLCSSGKDELSFIRKFKKSVIRKKIHNSQYLNDQTLKQGTISHSIRVQPKLKKRDSVWLSYFRQVVKQPDFLPFRIRSVLSLLFLQLSVIQNLRKSFWSARARNV